MSTQVSNYVIQRQEHQVQFYEEVLGEGVTLKMMSIPEGAFFMGSPKDELDRLEDEGPRHQVSVPAFSLGKYPVTQAQWRFVASLPQVNRELNPDPSRFKGELLPVERVSWFDAVEFCDRLTQHTTRAYRLPSEAEWEYACRAGTTTPFHFGETITTELANYQGTDDEFGSGSYGDGPKGEYRKQTTPVDHFGVTNLFGLCDMHGNVWEWCQDDWHGSYEGAPVDGSAWQNENDNRSSKIRRGGSWAGNPGNCRSAYRNTFDPDSVSVDLGFRVAFSAPRT